MVLGRLKAIEDRLKAIEARLKNASGPQGTSAGHDPGPGVTAMSRTGYLGGADNDHHDGETQPARSELPAI